MAINCMENESSHNLLRTRVITTRADNRSEGLTYSYQVERQWKY